MFILVDVEGDEFTTFTFTLPALSTVGKEYLNISNVSPTVAIVGSLFTKVTISPSIDFIFICNPANEPDVKLITSPTSSKVDVIVIVFIVEAVTTSEVIFLTNS